MTDQAHARHGDPDTSHAAAKSIKDLSANQRAVLAVFRLQHEPITDDQLIDSYRMHYKALLLPQQSESGIRSRRAELNKAGLLVERDKVRLKSGNLGRSWETKRHAGRDIY